VRWRISLELEDVYGGDGNLRYEPKEKVTLNRTRTKTMVRDSIGVAVKVGTEEEMRERKLEPIATFRLDGETPTLRLGGSHGKLWGAMKGAAKQLYDLGDEDFRKSYRAVSDMVMVSPAWVPLDVDGEIRLEGIPQVMKGSGGGMIVQYFDVIPKACASVVLTFPDVLAPRVRKLLSQLETGTHFNKRRAVIRIVEVREDPKASAPSARPQPVET